MVLSLLGCICMVLDPQAKRASNQSASITPALVDAFSAIFGAFYFLLSARHVKRIPICLLVFLMSAHTFLINSAIAKIHDSQIEFLSLDPTIGLFGFLNPS